MEYWLTFTLTGLFAFAAKLTGLILMLALKKTKSDEEYYETIFETVEVGFWFIAFLAVLLTGGFMTKIPAVLIVLAALATMGRGVYAIYKFTA